MEEVLPEHGKAKGAGIDRNASHVARTVLTAFLVTFMVARTVVFLIMSRALPDLYVHAGGTHIHHLNFGIGLLSAVGGWLLFRPPSGKALYWCAVAYGIGLALTFDEFGMWLHLGGGYWQRASFDAVIVVGALLTLIAFAPTVSRFRPRHWTTALVIAILFLAFMFGLVLSFRYAGHRIALRIYNIEEMAPR